MSERKWLKLIRRGNNTETIEPCERELKSLLDAWDVPTASSSLDEKVFASYRIGFQRTPFWKRIFTAQVRLPIPVAAMLILLAGALGWTVAGTSKTPIVQVREQSPIIQTKVVEVPVVQEKIVTRTIYVDRKDRLPEAKNLLAANQIVNGKKQTDKPVSIASQVSGDSAYTSVDLSGFQPVDEIKVTVIKGRNSGDK
ncbi:MAG TPA: hypothetical protein VEF04_17130 [Blastocatellia bacterium]|nr:hypothetical protein [Blastocatellia bacterium]